MIKSQDCFFCKSNIEFIDGILPSTVIQCPNCKHCYAFHDCKINNKIALNPLSENFCCSCGKNIVYLADYHLPIPKYFHKLNADGPYYSLDLVFDKEDINEINEVFYFNGQILLKTNNNLLCLINDNFENIKLPIKIDYLTLILTIKNLLILIHDIYIYLCYLEKNNLFVYSKTELFGIDLSVKPILVNFLGPNFYLIWAASSVNIFKINITRINDNKLLSFNLDVKVSTRLASFYIDKSFESEENFSFYLITDLLVLKIIIFNFNEIPTFKQILIFDSRSYGKIETVSICGNNVFSKLENGSFFYSRSGQIINNQFEIVDIFSSLVCAHIFVLWKSPKSISLDRYLWVVKSNLNDEGDSWHIPDNILHKILYALMFENKLFLLYHGDQSSLYFVEIIRNKVHKKPILISSAFADVIKINNLIYFIKKNKTHKRIELRLINLTDYII